MNLLHNPTHIEYFKFSKHSLVLAHVISRSTNQWSSFCLKGHSACADVKMCFVPSVVCNFHKTIDYYSITTASMGMISTPIDSKLKILPIHDDNSTWYSRIEPQFTTNLLELYDSAWSTAIFRSLTDIAEAYAGRWLVKISVGTRRWSLIGQPPRKRRRKHPRACMCRQTDRWQIRRLIRR